MSFWANLFSKKDSPVLQRLQQELDGLLNKSNSEFILLVGLTGKIKGINILMAKGKKETYLDKQLTRFAAKGAEFFLRFKTLEFIPPEFAEPAKVIKFYYNSEMSFYLIPIPGHESFMLLSYNAVAIKILNNMGKLQSILSEIKPDSESGESE